MQYIQPHNPKPQAKITTKPDYLKARVSKSVNNRAPCIKEGIYNVRVNIKE